MAIDEEEWKALEAAGEIPYENDDYDEEGGDEDSEKLTKPDRLRQLRMETLSSIDRLKDLSFSISETNYVLEFDTIQLGVKVDVAIDIIDAVYERLTEIYVEADKQERLENKQKL